jgi:hypothetical protein
MAGAAVGVVAGAAAVKHLQSKRVEAAGVLLNNTLVDRDDPSSLKREDVQAIEERYARLLPSEITLWIIAHNRVSEALDWCKVNMLVTRCQHQSLLRM